jgi:hypothetical protein
MPPTPSHSADLLPASRLLTELTEIINNEKYVIIDIGLKKTITAIPQTLRYVDILD